MNIDKFFELSAGKWFSHRTSHHLALNKSEHIKSDIIIETLTTENPDVIKLCKKHEIPPSAAGCAMRFSWKTTMDLKPPKQEGSTIVVTVPDIDKLGEGKLLRETGDSNTTSVFATYKMGEDESLTLMTEYENIYYQERLYFASPNLRMRVSVIKEVGEFSIASFTSEIRMGGKPASS